MSGNLSVPYCIIINLIFSATAYPLRIALRRKVSIRKDRDAHGIVPGYYWVSGGTDGNGKQLKSIRLAGKEHAMDVYHARVRTAKKHRDRMRRKK